MLTSTIPHCACIISSMEINSYCLTSMTLEHIQHESHSCIISLLCLFHLFSLFATPSDTNRFPKTYSLMLPIALFAADQQLKPNTSLLFIHPVLIHTPYQSAAGDHIPTAPRWLICNYNVQVSLPWPSPPAISPLHQVDEP